MMALAGLMYEMILPLLIVLSTVRVGLLFCLKMQKISLEVCKDVYWYC